MYVLIDGEDPAGDNVSLQPPNFPQPRPCFPEPWRPVRLSSKAEIIPLSMVLMNLQGTFPFLACSLLKEGSGVVKNNGVRFSWAGLLSPCKKRVIVSSRSLCFFWMIGERIR